MTQDPDPQPTPPEELPFVAPCRELTAGAPLRWIRSGWRDMRGAGRSSLAYGGMIVLLSYAISALGWALGGLAMLVALLTGFVLLGPALAFGLYSISYQLERGRAPSVGFCLRHKRRHLGQALVFGVILLVVFLVWARAASMVHVFFPVETQPAWNELALFYGIGTAVGAIFAAVIFAASAFSLPMIVDRRTDVVTAAVTSINAVLRNKPAMIVWAALIGLGVLAGFATAFLGLAVVIPLIGHATWHAYREAIDASAWPADEAAETPPPR